MRPPLQRLSSLKNVALPPEGSERVAQKAIQACQMASLDVQASVSRLSRMSANEITRCRYLGPPRPRDLSEASGLWSEASGLWKRGHIRAIAHRTSLICRLLTATFTLHKSVGFYQ